MRSLGIRTDGKAGSMVYPDRPGEPDCVYYLRTGMCGYGNNCKFNHPSFNGQQDNNQHGGSLPERVGEPDCVYFLKTGACKYGSSCKYNHPKDRNGAGPVILNSIGLPMRQEQKSCSHYLRTGSCKFGVACKFHHPQPVFDGLNPRVQGRMPYGPTGAPPYVGGAVAWPYPSPQTCVPLILPSSGPTRGWSPYYGNMSPILSANGLTSVDHVYQSTPSSNLPVRPGEPKCRHFVNTGTCKYGSDCKYHHPQEKMAQSDAASLGLFGLPLRPGQPICVYHSLYGMCKYGSGCKYDHPLVVYSYNYINGLTSQPLDGSSLLTYGGMSSQDSSPSKSLKNPRLTREPVSNGKVCTKDDSSGEHEREHAGSSHSSSSHNPSD